MRPRVERRAAPPGVFALSAVWRLHGKEVKVIAGLIPRKRGLLIRRNRLRRLNYQCGEVEQPETVRLEPHRRRQPATERQPADRRDRRHRDARRTEQRLRGNDQRERRAIRSCGSHRAPVGGNDLRHRVLGVESGRHFETLRLACDLSRLEGERRSTTRRVAGQYAPGDQRDECQRQHGNGAWQSTISRERIRFRSIH